MSAVMPSPSSITAAVKPLNAKAMLVKLTTTKPAMQRRDTIAEGFVQEQLGDTSLVVSSKLFKDKNHPIRVLLNRAGEVYSYHIAHTLPWTDRGPRMLPVDRYEDYTRVVREKIFALESEVARMAPLYEGYVLKDIADRNAVPPKPGTPFRTAHVEDYPAWSKFEASLKLDFKFTPLPDTSHFLFDISDEDKQSLTTQLEDAVSAAHLDMAARIHDPLMHLAKKLAVPLGADCAAGGGIFRDSAVNNVVEQCEIVESLAMGDEQVLAMVMEVRRAIHPMALAPDVLRESPVERSAAAVKLAEVAKRMSCMFGS